MKEHCGRTDEEAEMSLEGEAFNYDDILGHIGHMGKFQLRSYLPLCLPALFFGPVIMSYIFIGAIPKYRYVKLILITTRKVERRHLNSLDVMWRVARLQRRRISSRGGWIAPYRGTNPTRLSASVNVTTSTGTPPPNANLKTLKLIYLVWRIVNAQSMTSLNSCRQLLPRFN